jgi:hypothetical protein
MNIFDEIISTVKKVDDVSIGKAIFGNPEIKKLIIKLNTEKQLFLEGVDAQGKSLPLYSLKSKKKPNTPYNLKDTGDLYASFTVEVNSDGDAVVEADYLKDGFDLRNLTKSEFVGLTESSEAILQQEAEKIIKNYIIKTLNL